MEIYNVAQLGIMAVVISFLGFVLENVWLLVTKGYMDNRNMSLPFLLGYGGAVVGMYVTLGTPEEMVLFGYMSMKKHSLRARLFMYFAVVFVLVSLGEIAMGKLIEMSTGIICWDYTWLPMHVTRYTSVLTSLGFSLIITVFMNEFFVPIMTAIQSIDPVNCRNGCIVLLTLTSLDTMVSFNTMHNTHKLNQKWRAEPLFLKERRKNPS